MPIYQYILILFYFLTYNLVGKIKILHASYSTNKVRYGIRRYFESQAAGPQKKISLLIGKLLEKCLSNNKKHNINMIRHGFENLLAIRREHASHFDWSACFVVYWGCSTYVLCHSNGRDVQYSNNGHDNYSLKLIPYRQIKYRIQTESVGTFTETAYDVQGEA